MRWNELKIALLYDRFTTVELPSTPVPPKLTILKAHQDQNPSLENR